MKNKLRNKLIVTGALLTSLGFGSGCATDLAPGWAQPEFYKDNKREKEETRMKLNEPKYRYATEISPGKWVCPEKYMPMDTEDNLCRKYIYP